MQMGEKSYRARRAIAGEGIQGLCVEAKWCPWSKEQ